MFTVFTHFLSFFMLVTNLMRGVLTLKKKKELALVPHEIEPKALVQSAVGLIFTN